MFLDEIYSHFEYIAFERSRLPYNQSYTRTSPKGSQSNREIYPINVNNERVIFSYCTGMVTCKNEHSLESFEFVILLSKYETVDC